MSPSLPAQELRYNWVVCFLGVVGLWMLARPYTGVRHDGILYLGQFYLRLEPEIFGRDFFFAHGSQDQFSLFSQLGAWLHAGLGLEASQFLLLATGHTILLLAALWLTRFLGSDLPRLLGLMALAVMPHFYGGDAIMAFAETFVTARTLAEPFGLLALACLVYQRKVAAMLLGVAAAVIHPLMALPAFVAGWFWLVGEDRRWIWLGVPAALVVAVLTWFDVPPFDRLYASYDPEWLQIVQSANPLAFVTTWSPSAWARALGVLTFALWGARLLPRPMESLTRAAALAAAILLLISIVAADLAHSVFFTQLQLWRGLWLAHLLVILVAPAIFLQLVRRGRDWITAVVSLGAAAIALTAQWGSSVAIAGWAVLMCLLAQKQPSWLTARERSLLGIASWAVLVMLSALLMVQTIMHLLVASVEIGLAIVVWAVVTAPLIVFVAFWLGLLLVARAGSPRARATVATVVMACLLALGVGFWDRRTEPQRAAESRPTTPHPFTLQTEPSAQIFWEDSLNLTWAMLGRASYFTGPQGAGVLFSRPTAFEYERRRKIMIPLVFQRELCTALDALNQSDSARQDCVPDMELIEDICRADRGPDYLVFPFSLPRGMVARWDTPAQRGRTLTYYLHRCSLIA